MIKESDTRSVSPERRAYLLIVACLVSTNTLAESTRRDETCIECLGPSTKSSNSTMTTVSTPTERPTAGGTDDPAASATETPPGSDGPRRTVTGTEDPPSLVEDGEGDLSAYTGETGYFGTTSDAIEGSASVQAEGVEHGSYRTMVSLSGLETSPEAGDSFQCQVAVDTYSTYGSVLWGVQSSNAPWPCYRLVLDTGASPGIRFEKVASDGPIESYKLSAANELSGGAYHDDPAYKPTEGEVYTVSVDWQTDGTMPWTVTDSSGTVLAEDTSPTPDTEYTDGGVGFMSSRSWDNQPEARVRFDGYELV